MRTPDRSRLLQLATGRVYVRDRGPVDAAPLVLVHGLFVTHHTFRRVEPFAADRRLIAVDLLGCGESDRPPPKTAADYSPAWLADMVVRVLDALEVGSVDMVGHGYGASVTICAGQEHGDRVRRAVLVGPMCLSASIELDARLAMLATLGETLFSRLFGRSELRRYLERSLSSPELLDPPTLSLYWDRLARRGGRAAAFAMLQQLEALDHMRDRFPAVQCPVLLVWGDRDVLVPPETSDRLVELLSDAKVCIIDGCGHAVQEEQPEEFGRVLAEFCGS